MEKLVARLNRTKISKSIDENKSKSDGENSKPTAMSLDTNPYLLGIGEQLDLIVNSSVEVRDESSYKIDKNKLPFIVVKSAPSNLTKGALLSICNWYGTVYEIFHQPVLNQFQIYFENNSEMEDVYHGIKSSGFNFRIELGCYKDEEPKKKKPI